MGRFILCEIPYPPPEAEEALLAHAAAAPPKDIQTKIVTSANEIRQLFMGEDGNSEYIFRYSCALSS